MSILGGNVDNFKMYIFISIGFSIAGSINNLNYEIRKIFKLVIKRKDLINGETEYHISQYEMNEENNINNNE
jgi:hypothetical protein